MVQVHKEDTDCVDPRGTDNTSTDPHGYSLLEFLSRQLLSLQDALDLVSSHMEWLDEVQYPDTAADYDIRVIKLMLLGAMGYTKDLVRHMPCGYAGTAAISRGMEECARLVVSALYDLNRGKAVKKLRKKLAAQLRKMFAGIEKTLKALDKDMEKYTEHLNKKQK